MTYLPSKDTVNLVMNSVLHPGTLNLVTNSVQKPKQRLKSETETEAVRIHRGLQ